MLRPVAVAHVRPSNTTGTLDAKATKEAGLYSWLRSAVRASVRPWERAINHFTSEASGQVNVSGNHEDPRLSISEHWSSIMFPLSVRMRKR